MRRELLAVAVGAALTLLPQATGAPATLGVNLLANGDAETGDTTGWTTSGIEAFDDAGRVQNGTFFFWGGTAAVATATQEIDVSGLAATIGGGDARATLEGRLGGFSTQADHASVTVAELDGAGAVVDSFQIGPVTDTVRGNATTMLLRRVTDVLEATTRTLRVTLTATRFEGTNNDGSFDDLGLFLSDGPPDVDPGENLLVNGDAETGTASTSSSGSRVPVAGWETTTSFTIVQYGAGNFPDDAEGTRVGGGDDFFAGGPGAATATASQTVDVSGVADLIDAGEVGATTEALIGGFSTQEDRGQVDTIFRDASGTELGRQTLGPVAAADRGSQTRLEPRSATGVVPPGTRAVEVLLTATRFSGTANDGYFDNLRFSLSYTPAPPAPQSRTLTVVKTGSGAGTVTSAPPGISCGSDCTEALVAGTAVVLTATPAAGSTLAGISGCDATAGATCTVAVATDRDVTVEFSAAEQSPPPVPTSPMRPNLRVSLGSATAEAGRTASVSAQVANDGDATAATVVLAGAAPPEVIGLTPSRGACTLVGGRFVCELGELEPGASTAVEMRIGALGAATVLLDASAAASNGEEDVGDNTAFGSVEFVDTRVFADLSVAVTGPSEARPRGGVTFTARVSNGGPAVTPAAIHVAGDNALRILAVTPSGGTCSTFVETVCATPALAPGETVTLTVAAEMPRYLGPDRRPTLRVRATAEGASDSNPANDSGSVAVRLTGDSDCFVDVGFVNWLHCVSVGLAMTATSLAVVPGDELSLRTTVRAVTGSTAPLQVTVLQEVDGGADVIGATSPGGECSVDGERVTCVLRLGSAPVEVDVRVRVREPRDVVSRATATVAAHLQDTPRAELVVPSCRVVGTPGADTLRALGAGEAVCGLAGDDTLVLPGGGVAVAGAGNDVVTATAAARIEGGDGDDTLVGSLAADSIAGGPGNDSIDGGRGRDQLHGGDGNDRLVPGEGAASATASVTGGQGDDEIDARNLIGLAFLTADGGPGNDRLLGSSRAWLRGGDGADTLLAPGAGSSVSLGGGTGDDVLTGGAFAGGDEGADTLRGAPVMEGGDGPDTIHGTGASERIDAGAGADMVFAGAGADEIDAGDGTDTVFAADGPDRISGGLGNDRLDPGLGADVVDAGEGDDVVVGDTVSATVAAPGADNGDRIDGGAGRDELAGGTGADAIHGGGGKDVITGGGGGDTLSGGDGRDRLAGETGRDTLLGDADRDALYGGAGDDTLKGGAGRDAHTPGDGVDVVDARDAEGDLITCETGTEEGPFLIDAADSAPKCLSLFAFRLDTYNRSYGQGDAGYCIISTFWTSVDLTYRLKRGAHTHHLKSITYPGTRTQPYYHRFYRWSLYAWDVVGFELTAERAGRSLTHLQEVVFPSQPFETSSSCPPPSSSYGGAPSP